MGEYSNLVKAWLNSQPTKVDLQTALMMIRVLVRAHDELDKTIDVLKTVINDLEASLSVAENKITALEADVRILKGV